MIDQDEDAPHQVVPPPAPFPLEVAMAEAQQDPMLTEEDEVERNQDWLDPIVSAPARDPDRSEQHESFVHRGPSEETEPHAPAPAVLAPEQEPETYERALGRLPARWMRLFCLHIRQHGIIGLACQQARVSRETVTRYRKEIPLLDGLVVYALSDAADLIEASAVQLATVGVPEPVFQGGLLVGYRRKRDVKAIELLLKARKPEQFATETVQHRHTGRVEICPPAEVPKRVRDTQKRLFEAARAIGNVRVAGREPE